MIKPEVGRRIYWTMVSIDTFGLVGVTNAYFACVAGIIVDSTFCYFTNSRSRDDFSGKAALIREEHASKDGTGVLFTGSLQNLRGI